MTPARKEGRLARVGAEIVIIVIGVLIALWVDSLRETRRDAESQAYLLESLHSETVANLDTLRAAVRYNDRIIDDLKELLAIHEGRQTVPSSEAAKDLLVNAISWRPIGMSFGVYDAMAATGEARLLPGGELARRLAQERARFAAGPPDADDLARAIESMGTLMEEFGGLHRYMPTSLMDRLRIPDMERPGDIRGLLSDARFGSLAFRRILLHSNVNDFYRLQAEQLNETVALLEREMTAR